MSYRGRTIREAMKEAHENVDNYGGTWFVCSDEFMSVVKESYFITDEGVRKPKPFVCLYNTKDMRYGRHTVEWINGEIEIDTENDTEHRFEQPYSTKFVDEIPDDLPNDPFDNTPKFIVEDTYKELRELDRRIGMSKRHTMPYVRDGKKIGRNEPCPCDSGKKYKKCCG